MTPIPPTPPKTHGAPAVLALLLAVSAGWLAVPLATAQPVAVAAADPRASVVELQRQGRYREAYEVVRQLIGEDPERAADWGLHVLAGDLLERLGEPAAARQAFIDGMAGHGPLATYSRYRLARAHAESDHPEVATGLVAPLVRGGEGAVPSGFTAARLLRESVEAGGSCAPLRGLVADELAEAVRRQVLLTRALCLYRDRQALAAREAYGELLAERVDDEVGLMAAQALAGILRELRFANIRPSEDERRHLGLAFHQHREFSRAVSYLAPLVASFDGSLTGARYDLAYTLVRSRFWQERYAQAASGYRALAARAGEPRLVARALYQQARCHELLGDWPTAIATFRRAYRADPDGRAADNALIGALRLEFRQGREASALELFEILRNRRQWAATTFRAAFFLAASDLVRGRTDRADGWLDVAERTGGGDAEPELSYWRGRLAELDGQPPTAVARYLRVLRAGPYHPLAVDASRRLGREPLVATARAEAARRAASGTRAGLYDAWLLYDGDGRARGEVAQRLVRSLTADPAVADFLTLDLVATGDWPLWDASLNSAAEKLVGMGLWSSGRDALPDHFPLRDPSLGYTRSWLLARGGELRASLLVSELLARRAPSAVPEPFFPIGLQRLLYPIGHTDVLIREALGRGVDPFLLAAIVREESRFDHQALSPASARGLTQFVLPTAVRVAKDIGLPPLEPHHLYRPEVSLALGAAYLAELEDGFDGALHPVVVAYNAGPYAARLWRAYSYTDELPEFYSKVSYRETRNYLRKVVSSWEHYQEIYGAP